MSQGFLNGWNVTAIWTLDGQRGIHLVAMFKKNKKEWNKESWRNKEKRKIRAGVMDGKWVTPFLFVSTIYGFCFGQQEERRRWGIRRTRPGPAYHLQQLWEGLSSFLSHVITADRVRRVTFDITAHQLSPVCNHNNKARPGTAQQSHQLGWRKLTEVTRAAAGPE